MGRLQLYRHFPAKWHQFVVFFINDDFVNDTISTVANLFLVGYWEYLFLVKMQIHIILEIRRTKLPLLIVETLEEFGV